MKILHWLVALLIFGQLVLGWYMTPYQESPEWDQYYYYHKSFGVLIFILVIARLINRSRSEVPELPESLPELDRKMAHVGHIALYVLMFLVPVLGYLMSSSFEYSDGVYLFSLFDVPELLPKSELGFELFNWAHAISAYLLLAIVGLHVAGALKHRFFDSNKDNDVLSRML
jgi:cytochrome b561